MNNVMILVVDDQAIIAEDLIMKIADMGYDGCSVSSGEEAIDKISHQFIPDLILMDVNLKGGENGIQTARLIQQISKIPILFVTAYPSSFILNAIEDLALTGYIQKPFDKGDLLISIRKLLAAA